MIWNNGVGNFIGSPTWSYDNAGTVATTSNPFTHLSAAGGSGGENVLLIGNGGVVTLNTPNQGPFADNSLHEIRVGTAAVEADLSALPGGADFRGNGELTVENGVDLLLFDTDTVGAGRLIVGGADGITGTVNWNSTGEMNANGHLRIGQGGTGVFNQNAGLIRSGNTVTGVAGGNEDMRIGSGGGNGTLNLNDGAMEVGAADDGGGLEIRAGLQVGLDNNSTGTFNLGDGSGAPGSASFQAWGTVTIGNAGAGVLNINPDGLFKVNFTDAVGVSSALRVGQSGGGTSGTINLNGGQLLADGLLELGFNTGMAAYNLNGSTGTATARALAAYQNASFTFNLDSGGATRIRVAGNTGSGDVAAGNSISLSNPALTINGLANYASSSPIILFEQLDSTASLTGLFANAVQGQSIGTNASSQTFYFNYYGGDGNDIVLQSTLPSSSTDGLVWNIGAANFGVGWATGDGSFGVGATGVDPFAGLQNLYLGKGGVATYNAATNDLSGNAVKNIYVGTNKAAGIIAGTNGNGTLNVEGSESLIVNDAPALGAQGMAFIGENGFAGTLSWNSTGTFDVQGQFRVGIAGGTGVVNQTAGIVQGGTTGGGGKYLAFGEGAGSNGTYNLKAGQLLPDGPGIGPARRQMRVGIDGGVGALNVGDGVGAALSAHFQSEDDLWISGGGGTGRLTVESDGFVELLTDDAPLEVGRGGGNGTVTQNSGSVSVAGLLTIGQSADSIGLYELKGGSLIAAADGAGDVRIGGAGGSGTMRVSGTGAFSTVDRIIIAESANTSTVGRLEFIGSQASFSIGRLENDDNNEVIKWTADANGVTPIVIQGGAGNNRAQLQEPNDVNTGTNGMGDLMGDGIALELDLSALTTSQGLTLIDNRSNQAIVGFFENGTTGDLYEEGEQILNTGFNGSVTISYIGTAPSGSAGNDVVLNLFVGAVEDADFDQDGDVDGGDFLAWQRGFGISSGANLGQGDANGDGAVNGSDLTIWKGQFGTPAGTAAAEAVPEPAAAGLLLMSLAALVGCRRSAK